MLFHFSVRTCKAACKVPLIAIIHNSIQSDRKFWWKSILQHLQLPLTRVNISILPAPIIHFLYSTLGEYRAEFVKVVKTISSF